MTKVMNGPTIATFKQETAVSPYRIVTFWTDADEVIQDTGTSEPKIGISDESADATADNPVGVVMDGIAKLTILAASTKGDYITGTTAGKGLATTTDTQEVIGVLLETTTVANQVAAVAIRPWTFAG